MTIFKKATLAAALAATAIAATATAAMARPYDRAYHRGGDNTAAVAIGAGILGLAVGAIAASSNNNDRYRDQGYYDNRYEARPAYVSDWSYRDGYYWDRDGARHSRDEYARYHRDGYGRNYDDYRRGY